MRNFMRGFIAVWYLLGWMVHIYLAISSSQMYSAFGKTSLITGYSNFWQGWIMPRISFFAILLAVFEIVVGLLIISKGKWVKYGLALSTAFNIFLIQMGLGMPAISPVQDFLINRLPNITFLLIQIPLFWGSYENNLIQSIKKR